MTHQNNAAQPLLTDDAIERIRIRAEKDSRRFGHTVDIPIRADLLLALVSKLRAPVADERAAQGYGSPVDVVSRIEQFIAKNGRQDSATLLLYEAMKALRRPVPAAGDAQELTLAQKYEDACILANANAQDAARYRSHRAALTSVNTAWLDNVTAALEAMGLDPEDADALPTAEQVDAAFDAAITAQQGKGDSA